MFKGFPAPRGVAGAPPREINPVVHKLVSATTAVLPTCQHPSRALCPIQPDDVMIHFVLPVVNVLCLAFFAY